MAKKYTIVLCLSLFFGIIHAGSFTDSRKIYSVVEDDGHRMISGFQGFNSSDEVILANAMKWAIEQFCNDQRDGLFEIQVNKKNFSFYMPLDYVVDGKTKYSFYCKGNIKVAEGKLVFMIYDIQYKANSLVPLSSTSSIDKLTPEKKPKHKEIITAFQELGSKKLNQLFDAVEENQCKEITHWKEIDIQKPVKGMNEDECLLAFGKPKNIYEDNNNRIQWSYGLNFVLIFENKILQTIIE